MSEGLPGTVVLLAERGELGPAWVVSRDGSRFVLQNLLGERFAVSLPRLFWVGRKALASPDELPAYWQEVKSLAERADLVAAWGALDHATVGPASIAAHALGREGPAAEDAVALAIFLDPSHFRLKDRALLREAPAEVAETLRKRAEKEAARTKLAAAERWIRERLARAATDAPPCDPTPLDPDYRRALVDVAARGRECERFAFAEPLLQALAIPFGAPALPVFELLVTLGELAPDTNLAPLRAGVSLAFTPEIEAEAARLATAIRPNGKVLDGLLIVAIDDPDTTEIDDAVAIDPRDPERLHVLVADAALWVQPGSALDVVARERASTIYLPEGKVPMVPSPLAEGVMSLFAGAPRSALDFSFRIDAEGRARELDIARVEVTIARALTYEEADVLLVAPDGSRDTSPGTSAVAATLARAAELVGRHRDARHRRGAVTFQRPEIYWVREPDGTVRQKVGDPLGPARQLVAELMVATCAAAAEYCVDRGIPCLYRAQAPPDEPPPPTDPKTGRIDDPALQYELLRRLKPSVLTTTPEPHFTLGVSAYTQLTSPIRRYADLLMHQQIASVLRTGRPVYSAKNLETFIFELGRRSGVVKRVEQESRRFFALRWLAQSPPPQLVGRVVRELGKKTLVELESLGIQELVSLRRRRPPGDNVRLTIVACDARRDTLELRELT
ncbi:MAG: RNB domain-containing ribonuclease [Deltaproteobacteria bacterium]|nr:RNB domain-containing ribonuclease [Deltaproteobacteria bacterium]